MKARTYLHLSYCLVFIGIGTFSACKSSFPAASKPIECNGHLLRPISNPTEKAYFPGGPQAMSKFLKENIKLSQGAQVKGLVRIAFIITKDGDICDIRITSKPKEYIDDEVTRVVKLMPKWIPAKKSGELIDSYYLLDMNF